MLVALDRVPALLAVRMTGAWSIAWRLFPDPTTCMSGEASSLFASTSHHIIDLQTGTPRNLRSDENSHNAIAIVSCNNSRLDLITRAAQYR